MKRRWTSLKQIIGPGRPQQIFLSLIDEEGNILSANANMVRELDFKNPKFFKVNFFNIIHPANAGDFKQLIATAAKEKVPQTMELYIRNGYYHPMKWELNLLESEQDDIKKFLCVGYKLVDEDRLEKFHQLGAKNYQLIFERLNAGIIFQDANGEFIAANQKAADIFQVSLERFYQLQNIKNLWNTTWNITTEKGESIPFEETPFMKALQTGNLQKETLVIRLRNGEKRWVLFDSQPLFEPDQSVPFSVVSNIIDVTKEKKLSNQLEELDTILKVFLDKTPNLAWIVDEEANLVYASRSFYDYYDIDGKNAVGRKITDLIPGAVAKALYEKHAKVLNTGMPDETEEKIMLADGTNIIFHINIFPVEGLSGKKLVGGHAVNLANKYFIEKQLREANERLLNFNRAASNAIWEWDMQTGKIFRNENLLDMIGYPVEETKGLTWWFRRIHPDDRERVSEKIKETTDLNKISWQDEYRFKCADGTYKHIHDRGFIIYENGLPVKMIGSLQDITDLKLLKDQLMEEKLQRQREISETVIRVQERERRRIGHELHDNVNQILTTVRLFVEMLTPANNDELDIKKKSVEYILTAIEEIRKLSRELAVPELKEKSLVETIRKLVDDINISNAVKVKFVHDAECDLLSPGKKVTLFRILQEQMKNILKYSKAREVSIYLDCKSDQALLIIQDNGIGFDASQTQSGVGLSSIYDRTNFYNGSVHIDTAPGKGCTLTVKIPIL
ncbi:MAG TPA: PAS domain S-box protein [Chitinophagaceae bacterium]|nr:PAS domain S-box protein [Chitinophagaceae bacterium]